MLNVSSANTRIPKKIGEALKNSNQYKRKFDIICDVLKIDELEGGNLNLIVRRYIEQNNGQATLMLLRKDKEIKKIIV